MKKQNIDLDKVMNNAFIKPQLKWMQFLLSALDVYRRNTELEITSVNGTSIDTVVVFKKD